MSIFYINFIREVCNDAQSTIVRICSEGTDGPMMINHTRYAPTLIGNYVKVAARNLMRNKAYSTLNILGLGIAMSCCLLIVLFLQHELQYDQFYTKGDRIYKVVRETYGQGGPRYFYWGTSGSLGSALQRDFPEAETVVRIWPWNVKVERFSYPRNRSTIARKVRESWPRKRLLAAAEEEKGSQLLGNIRGSRSEQSR